MGGFDIIRFHLHDKAALADDCTPAAQPGPITVSPEEPHGQDMRNPMW